jgi:hypothetical protein
MEYPNFINRVVGNLVKVAKVSKEDLAAVRGAYLYDLSRALTSFDGNARQLFSEYDEDPTAVDKVHMLPKHRPLPTPWLRRQR